MTPADVLVSFVGRTDQLTAQGRANLVSIAAALNGDQLEIRRFEIADFVDASGSEVDRFFLSQHRAETVRHELILLGVSDDRLQASGYGADHLADPSRPHALVNQRVAIRLLN